MKLTRRDAVKALLGGGFASAATVASSELIVNAKNSYATRPMTDAQEEIFISIAEVVYPPEVAGISEFAQEYLQGLDEANKTMISEATNELDRQSRRRLGRPFVELTIRKRQVFLRSMGVYRVKADPRGSLPERIRYYLVNELIYALLITPKGTKLFGIENPVGFPGGFSSFTVEP